MHKWITSLRVNAICIAVTPRCVLITTDLSFAKIRAINNACLRAPTSLYTKKTQIWQLYTITFKKKMTLKAVFCNKCSTRGIEFLWLLSISSLHFLYIFKHSTTKNSRFILYILWSVNINANNENYSVITR